MCLLRHVTQAITQILIVDDQEMIREGIRALLASRPQWQICGEAVDGLDALHKTKLLGPDIVLMDLSMPRMDGLTATRILKRQAPGTRVIIVTQNEALEHRTDSMHADGRVFKTQLYRDLIPAIEHVLNNAPQSSDADLNRA